MNTDKVIEKKEKYLTAKLSLGCALLEVLYFVILSMEGLLLSPWQSHPILKYRFITMRILLFINVLGVILGLVSIMRNEKKRNIAYLGLFINSLSIIVSVIIWIIIK